MTPEDAALAAGATQLGEDGPDGAHWIFSREQLAAFARAVAGAAEELPPRQGLPPLPY